MVWYAWVLAGFIGLNAVAKIALTGRRKDPAEHTPAEAVGTLIYSVLAIWVIITLAS